MNLTFGPLLSSQFIKAKSVPVSLVFVHLLTFIEHVSWRAGCHHSWQKINKFALVLALLRDEFYIHWEVLKCLKNSIEKLTFKHFYKAILQYSCQKWQRFSLTAPGLREIWYLMVCTILRECEALMIIQEPHFSFFYRIKIKKNCCRKFVFIMYNIGL